MLLIEIHQSNYWEILTFVVSLGAILGHNLWLVGLRDASGKTKIEVNTGDDFPTSDSAVRTERIADFKVFSVEGVHEIDDFQVEGNSLTAFVEQKPSAPMVASIDLFPHPITLDAAKFAHYIEDEEAAEFVAPDFLSGRTNAPQRESYAKFAKVLSGTALPNFDLWTTQIGQKLEITLTEPPFSTADKLRVRVLFENRPAIGLRVSAGAENFNGGRYFAHARTDENGFAELELPMPEHCFVRTHFIRRHADAENFEWESFWASVTFRV